VGSLRRQERCQSLPARIGQIVASVRVHPPTLPQPGKHALTGEECRQEKIDIRISSLWDMPRGLDRS
jgi:hypothetical protein